MQWPTEMIEMADLTQGGVRFLSFTHAKELETNDEYFD